MRRTLIGATVATAAIAVTSPASADYYMSKKRAEQFARHYVRDKYEYDASARVVAFCLPQNQRYDSDYRYHRWKCGWAGEGDCSGLVRIVGSRGRGFYYGRVLQGVSCD